MVESSITCRLRTASSRSIFKNKAAFLVTTRNKLLTTKGVVEVQSRYFRRAISCTFCLDLVKSSKGNCHE